MTIIEEHTAGTITYGMVVETEGCPHAVESYTGPESKVPMVRCRVCGARGLQHGRPPPIDEDAFT